MRKFDCGDFDLFLGSKWFVEHLEMDKRIRSEVGLGAGDMKEFLLELQNMTRNTLRTYFTEGAYERYIKLFARIAGLPPRFAVLQTHGFTHEGRWAYDDGGRIGLVQRWIDRRDGQYTCILLDVCNAEQHCVNSRRSLLVYADAAVGTDGYGDTLYSESGAPLETHHFSLVHPELGEIDDYVIDYELKRLELLLGC